MKEKENLLERSEKQWGEGFLSWLWTWASRTPLPLDVVEHVSRLKRPVTLNTLCSCFILESFHWPAFYCKTSVTSCSFCHPFRVIVSSLLHKRHVYLKTRKIFLHFVQDPIITGTCIWFNGWKWLNPFNRSIIHAASQIFRPVFYIPLMTHHIRSLQVWYYELNKTTAVCYKDNRPVQNLLNALYLNTILVQTDHIT